MSQVEEQYDWGAQVEIQRLAVMAWTEHAEGHNASALRAMRSAAELEDKSDKHPVTPGPVLPARELLGDLLMELNRPDLAFPEFDAALHRSPGRFNATYGRARAAELCGNQKYATKHFRELVELCGRADTQRLELQNARSFLDKADAGR